VEPVVVIEFNNLATKHRYSCSAVISVLIVGLYLLMQAGLAAATSRDGSSELSPLTSWDAIRQDAKAGMKPIVLLVEQRHCGFCQRAKAERLRPASTVGEYAGRAIFVSVATDLDEPPVDADGSKISTFEFAENYAATFTPTVMFLDYRGVEIQERMVGYTGDVAESAVFEARLSRAIEVVSISADTAAQPPTTM
jgi:thioredoxin-related protein